MRNRIGLLSAWVLATAVAVGVASQAVGLVADRAVEVPVQVPVAVTAASSFSTTSTLPAGTVATDPPPTTTGASATTSPPSTGSTPTTSASATTTTSALTQTSTTVQTTTTTSPVPLDSGTVVATGGQVTAACTSATTITLLGAVPVTGWNLEVESSGPEKVRVDFELGEQESEIEIVCVNGRLQADISHE